MVQPAVMAGGVFLLIIIVVVVLGMMSKPKFWGLFSSEFDACTSNTVYISNASTYQLDSDKKCILVKTCATGYKPNSSNTACVSTDTGGGTPSAGGGGTPSAGGGGTPPPPPAAKYTETRRADSTGEPKPNWANYATDMLVPNALQYGKLKNPGAGGANWEVSMCNLNYVPYTNDDEDDAKLKPKLCELIGNDPESVCKNKLSGSRKDAKTFGLTPTGKCGSVSCKDTKVVYDGKCVPATAVKVKKWEERPGSKKFAEVLKGQPAYTYISKDKLSIDRSCRDMCTNKEFKSDLPTNWNGSVASFSTPTQMMNYSIEEIATNPDLWDQAILDAFIEFLEKGVTTALQMVAEDVIDITRHPPAAKGFPTQIYASKVLLGLKPGGDTRESFSEADINNWKAFFMTKANCGCEATDDAGYLWQV